MRASRKATDTASPKAIADYVAAYLDLWARDEALGFEGIFFSEHHFGGSFGASPNLLIAAMASRTRMLRLGVMGVVLPYYHPTRVVEEIGLLDPFIYIPHVTLGVWGDEDFVEIWKQIYQQVREAGLPMPVVSYGDESDGDAVRTAGGPHNRGTHKIRVHAERGMTAIIPSTGSCRVLTFDTL